MGRGTRGARDTLTFWRASEFRHSPTFPMLVNPTRCERRLSVKDIPLRARQAATSSTRAFPRTVPSNGSARPSPVLR